MPLVFTRSLVNCELSLPLPSLSPTPGRPPAREFFASDKALKTVKCKMDASRDELTLLRLAEAAAQERAAGAESWRTLNSDIWDEAVQHMKSKLEREWQVQLEAKTVEIEANIRREFQELMRQCGKEIELYIAHASREKQESFAYLLQQQQVRGPQMRDAQAAPSPFDEDFAAIESEIRQGGEDLGDVVRLADGCFLYHGRVLVVGDMVRVQTRVEGRTIEAVVGAVTTGELVLKFRDGSKMVVDVDDLVSHKVVLATA